MSVSDSQRAAKAKWDRENLQIVSCKVKKEEAEAFRAAAKKNNTTPYAVLRDCIFRYINENNKE